MAKAHGRSRKRQGPALITDARGSRIKNFDHRRHVYAILQWSRIPLLLLSGAAIMWWDNKWLAALFVIASVPMSWIAVVIANGVGEPEDKRAPRVYKPGVIREQNRQWEQQQKERALAEARMRELGTASAAGAGGAANATEAAASNAHTSDTTAADTATAGTAQSGNRGGSFDSFDQDLIIDMPTDLPER